MDNTYFGNTVVSSVNEDHFSLHISDVWNKINRKFSNCKDDRLLGGFYSFGRNNDSELTTSVNITITELAYHEQILIKFTLYIIDEWIDESL